MEKKEIVYVLGTKAQLIKSKFILNNLLLHNFKITIVDTGQHKEITSSELEYFKSNFKYISISKNTKNISSIFSMIIWFLKISLSYNQIKIEHEAKYCLIHGDTISTLVGLIVGKKNKLEVVHIESGLRSYNLFRPFPEEIIRMIVTKYSDVLSVDTKEAEKNIEKYIGYKKIIRISRNTIYDSVVDLLKNQSLISVNCLTVTVHRTENLYNKKRLQNFVNLLTKINNLEIFENINWYCHDVTIKALEKNGHLLMLKNSGVKIYDLVSHDKFLSILHSSRTVITDGGSIAEECSIMNLKTVIWRDVVENYNYLNENMLLSKYNEENIIDFLNSELNFNKQNIDTISPSVQFVNQLIDL